MLSYSDNSVHDFITLMYSFSLFPLITRTTRVTDNTATLIDHIWSTQVEPNVNNLIIETDISDHFPIISQFDFTALQDKTRKYKEIRIYSDSALKKLQ